MKYDRILRGGTVVDGTGAPGRRADLAMKDGRVFFPEASSALIVKNPTAYPWKFRIPGKRIFLGLHWI